MKGGTGLHAESLTNIVVWLHNIGTRLKCYRQSACGKAWAFYQLVSPKVKLVMWNLKEKQMKWTEGTDLNWLPQLRDQSKAISMPFVLGDTVRATLLGLINSKFSLAYHKTFMYLLNTWKHFHSFCLLCTFYTQEYPIHCINDPFVRVKNLRLSNEVTWLKSHN